MQAAIIQHIAFEGVGNLGSVLKDKGFEITTYHAGIDDLQELQSSSPELLIILGAPIGVYEQESYPYLNDTLEIIRQRIEEKKAIIGICLGCQLIAHALGSKVYPGKRKEIGWSTITTYQTESTNPLSAIPNSTPVLHWHGDTFDLPDGAIRLASSELYHNQAFTFGENILAIQFHPEVEKESLEQWYLGHAHEIASTEIKVPELRKDGLEYIDQLQAEARIVWGNWINKIL